jgi:hypothetical protein
MGESGSDDVCTYADCDREPYAKRSGELYCRAHYMQAYRRTELRPLRTAPGMGTVVSIRVPVAIRKQIKIRADAARIDEAEWWRRAAFNMLEAEQRRDLVRGPMRDFTAKTKK